MNDPQNQEAPLSAAHDVDDYFEKLLRPMPVMAILRNYDIDKTVRLATQAWDAGVTAVEVPIQTPAAVRSLRAAVDAGRERGFDVGAGTVLSATQVAVAADAGARFTVAPGLDPAVVSASIERGLPHLPGVGSATELQAAMGLGLTWVKVFPAAALGSRWFSAMRGPFPQVRLVAVGGLTQADVPTYLACGADAVGLGSELNAGDGIQALVARLAGQAPDRPI